VRSSSLSRRSPSPGAESDTNSDADAPHISGSGSGSGSGSDDDEPSVADSSDPNYIPEIGIIRGTSRGSQYGMELLCPVLWKNKAKKFIGRVRSRARGNSDPEPPQQDASA